MTPNSAQGGRFFTKVNLTLTVTEDNPHQSQGGAGCIVKTSNNVILSPMRYVLGSFDFPPSDGKHWPKLAQIRCYYS